MRVWKMASGNECKELVIPSIAMVAVELSSVVGNILLKAASSKAMNYLVYIAYTNILGTLVFLLLATLFSRKTVLPPLKFPLFSRIFIFGLLGFLSQLLICKGLELGSPTLLSALVNLIPAFTFVFAVFVRMEKVAIRSSSSQAKIIGTVTSICGAFVVIFYKGSKLISSLTLTSSSSALVQKPPGLMSAESNWIIGGLLQAVACILYSFSYTIQSQIMKIYPEEITVNFFYNLLGTIISLPVCLILEPNLSSWRLSSSVAAATVLYSGLFALPVLSIIHIWGVGLKGPVFVASFTPTQIAIAVVMSAIFLGEAVFLGSVIGSLILCVGLYWVLWGKAKEQEMTNDDSGLSTVDDRVPLLLSQQSWNPNPLVLFGILIYAPPVEF